VKYTILVGIMNYKILMLLKLSKVSWLITYEAYREEYDVRYAIDATQTANEFKLGSR
jgi:dTDP-D-glucose 4,6-dehydratase